MKSFVVAPTVSSRHLMGSLQPGLLLSAGMGAGGVVRVEAAPKGARHMWAVMT